MQALDPPQLKVGSVVMLLAGESTYESLLFTQFRK